MSRIFKHVEEERTHAFIEFRRDLGVCGKVVTVVVVALGWVCLLKTIFL